MTDQSPSFYLKTYRALTTLGKPLIKQTVKNRIKKNKEDPERYTERFGVASKPRPDGKVLWIHGASVGESLSILPLITHLTAQYPDLSFLVTTGTLTSASLMARRLPDHAVHQFFPLDQPDFVDAFLSHWQPDAGIFIESEIWPNLIMACKSRNIPLALVNGRMSPKSFKSWSKRPDTIHMLLNSFDVLTAQDSQNAARLNELAKTEIAMHSNLKFASPILPYNEAEVEAFNDMVLFRPVWLAASTHEGEEDIVLDAHLKLKAQFPDLLTIIVPRHPERGAAVMALAQAKNCTAIRRSTSDLYTDETEIYIADTLGEMGLFYKLNTIVFVGGSLLPIGGHNPLEPARLRAAILHGPHIFNFEDTYKAMRLSEGTALIRTANDLTAALSRLLTDVKTRDEMSRRAMEWSTTNSERVLVDLTTTLSPLLKKIT